MKGTRAKLRNTKYEANLHTYQISEHNKMSRANIHKYINAELINYTKPNISPKTRGGIECHYVSSNFCKG